MFLIYLYLILIIHEAIHYYVAILFNYIPTCQRVSFFSYKVTYVNKNKPLESLIIAIAPTLFFIIVGILLPSNEYTASIKLLCFLHLGNLTILTNDGEVIILSIIQLYRK